MAHSSTRSATTRRTPKRPSKLQLFRVKVAAVVGALVLFFASLAGIAIYNPGVASQAAAPAQVQQITIVKPSTPSGSNSVVLPPPPRVTAVRPFVRTRGS